MNVYFIELVKTIEAFVSFAGIQFQPFDQILDDDSPVL
jgi:hypothetical protein